MQQSGFLYLFFWVLITVPTSHCTNNTDPEILPLDEGYKPDQVIEFPHEIHAKNGIDCKYCHHAAIDGEADGIPTASVCMKCHKQVSAEKPE